LPVGFQFVRLTDSEGFPRLKLDEIKAKAMKSRLMSSFAVLAMLLAISSPSPAFGNHPEIEDALHALHVAKSHLEHASHDFQGHRVDAIRAIDEADRQLRICMQY
jgi:hypothetical protein